MMPAEKKLSRRSNPELRRRCLHRNRIFKDGKPIFQLSGRNQKDDAGKKETVPSIQSGTPSPLSPQKQNLQRWQANIPAKWQEPKG